MNAQEAIERVKEKVEKLQNDYDFWLEANKDAIMEDCSGVEFTRGVLSDIEKELFPLKIVLESAKFLHKELINEELTQHLENTKILYLNTEYAENKAIANSKAKMIGMEGADE